MSGSDKRKLKKQKQRVLAVGVPSALDQQMLAWGGILDLRVIVPIVKQHVVLKYKTRSGGLVGRASGKFLRLPELESWRG